MQLTDNFQLELPFRGEYPGRWDIPVNNNFVLIDEILKELASNYAGTTQPSSPRTGSLWFDTSASKLKVKKPSGFYEIVDNENIYVILGGEPVLRQPLSLVVPENIVVNKWVDFGTVNKGTIEVTWNAQNSDATFGTYVVSIQREDEPDAREYYTSRSYYKFENLHPDNIYKYAIKIRAIDKFGNGTVYSSSVNVFLTDNQNPPDIPGTITVGGGLKKLIVTFNKVSNLDIAGYEIHVSETAGFTPDCTANMPAPNNSTTLKYRGSDTLVAVPVDKSDFTYYLKIRAWNTSGKYSSFSSQASAKTKQIDATDIVPLTIDSALIADAAIVNAKIGDLDGGKVWANSITANKIAAETITADKLYAGGNLVDVGAYKNITVSGGTLIEGGPTYYSQNSIGRWRVMASDMPAYIMVDLTGTNGVTVGEIAEISFSAYPTNDTAITPKHYKIECSTDALVWNGLKEVTNNTQTPVYAQCPSFDARYIRVTVLAGQTAGAQVFISKLQVKAKRGGTLITGDTIKTGTITAGHISATTLSSITANLGFITAGTIDMQSANSYIRGGQPLFNTGTGFWLGRDTDGKAKFSVGNAGGGSISFDGEQLTISSGVVIGGSIAGDLATKADVSYKVEIISSQGIYLRKTVDPNTILSTLYAKVYKGATEVTNTIPETKFIWTRSSLDSSADAAWNLTHGLGAKYINIKNNDVNIRATFNCTILDM